MDIKLASPDQIVVFREDFVLLCTAKIFQVLAILSFSGVGPYRYFVYFVLVYLLRLNLFCTF
jgi:hypothetical protein